MMSPMTDTLSILLTLLAVPRITRFVTEDTIFDGPRNWVLRHLLARNPDHKLAVLLLCPWCVSVYAGTAAAAAWWAWGGTRIFTAAAAALAASYVAGFLAGKE